MWDFKGHKIIYYIIRVINMEVLEVMDITNTN